MNFKYIFHLFNIFLFKDTFANLRNLPSDMALGSNFDEKTNYEIEVGISKYLRILSIVTLIEDFLK